ncbi:MAG TPA: fumarylacetoacetase [Terriglobales bacterium]|jgi:fumarylacetoacetase|nr:fumarylacetoacetase [Terriglobales bacterium]
MKPVLDETHDSKVRSWVESANVAGADFPLQNLPFAVFRRPGQSAEPSLGIAIGDRVLDLRGMQIEPSFAGESTLTADACAASSLNSLMALPVGARRALRRRLHAILRQDAPGADRQAASRHLFAQSDVDLLLPAATGDYTDFYASIFHATNVGKLFRPDNPLLPNYKFIPIGYHGRASSLVPSKTPIRRPNGQTRDGDAPPRFGPAKALDYELEVGFFVSAGNNLGEPIPIAEAEEHIFGICLLNDWSARDIQAWEYQPLGPFLGKSFATSLSPWVVTMEALAPFRTAAFVRPEGDPAPLPYLFDQNDQDHGGVDLHLEVALLSPRMREQGMAPVVLGRSNFSDMYWTMAQLLTHHASNGCNLRPGDLLASGTVSGPDKSACGSLLELTSRGKDPVTLPTGEPRKFLEDEDEVILRGFCERDGFRRIGLGGCSGMLLPANATR